MSSSLLVASLLLPLTLGEIFLFPTFTCIRGYHRNAVPEIQTTLCDSFCYTDYTLEDGAMVVKRQGCSVPLNPFAQLAFFFKYGFWPTPQCFRDGRSLTRSGLIRVCCSKDNRNEASQH